MTIKKLLKQKTCLIKFLLRFNFVIFYTLDRENKKIDSFTH